MWGSLQYKQYRKKKKYISADMSIPEAKMCDWGWAPTESTPWATYLFTTVSQQSQTGGSFPASASSTQTEKNKT